ncbi:MAG: magnesium/cobalt transporter CorA [Deltaproteobacteria bacterium]|jgi:magnesium transporter|nr:magnesium/cobalt transporter CorA [Deltaproteobacteria bacterium]
MASGKNKEPSVVHTRSLRRIAARVSLRPGASPGTLTPISGSASATVTVFSIAADGSCSAERLDDLGALPGPSDKGVRWVRVVGLGSVAPLQTIASFYGIRRLVLEDILSPGWRTKMEDLGEYAFFLLQAPPEALTRKRGDRLSLFCRPGLVITFEDAATKLVDSLWERLEEEPFIGRMAHLSEFLTYMALDIIVDAFFPHLDEKDEILAELEEKISDHVPDREDLNRLHMVKSDLLTLRRLLSPFRELRQDLQRMHTPEPSKELRPFLNDLYDHIVQAGELLDTYYEVAKSLDEISQSAISNRMNDIIRILTLISTVFMPLSFVASLYGMNFNTEFPLNMPELSLPYGYLMVLLVMVGIVSGMLWFFKKKRWL